MESLSSIINGITVHILNTDVGKVLTTGLGLFKYSMNVNLMKPFILVSVSVEKPWATAVLFRASKHFLS